MPIAVRRAPDQVHGAVGDGGGAEKNLLQGAPGPDVDAGATWEVGVGAGHAPVVASAGASKAWRGVCLA